MAGASTPANPEPPTPTGYQGTSGLSPQLSTRSRATGQEAEYLQEAGARLEAVTSVLAAAALGHVDDDDLLDAITPVIAVLDDAARYVQLAGDP